MSCGSGPVVADGDIAQHDGGLESLAAASESEQAAATTETKAIVPDEVRTAEDSLALLDSLVNDLLPAAQETNAECVGAH